MFRGLPTAFDNQNIPRLDLGQTWNNKTLGRTDSQDGRLVVNQIYRDHSAGCSTIAGTDIGAEKRVFPAKIHKEP